MREALFSDGSAKVYLRLTRWLLRSYREHSGYDDLLGHCLCVVCEALAKRQPEEREAATGYVAGIVENARREWLRGPQNPERRQTRAGYQVPETVSLDSPAAIDGEETSLSRWSGHLSAPDFAPAVIHRVWTEGVWREAMTLMSDRERVAVTAWACDEWSLEEIGAKLGCGVSRLNKLMQTGLNRYRRQVGAPLKSDGTPQTMTDEQRARQLEYRRQWTRRYRAAQAAR